MDGGTQMRQAIDEATVHEYAEAMAAGDRFPPVIVFHDGSDYWLGDGFHRIRAVDYIGQTEIAADVRAGTRRDAILHAVSANRAHGLRRTNDDKRIAVFALLNDEEWTKWADREIARQCGVSQPFVSKLRKEMSASDNGYQIPGERKVQRGDQEYTMKSPTYVAVSELEEGVRLWVDGQQVESLTEQIAELEKIREWGRQFDQLCDADELPGPRRKRDIKQAVNNVLEQLRIELMERYRIAAAQQDSKDSSPSANRAMATGTGATPSTNSATSEPLPLPPQHVAALDDYRSVITNIQFLLQSEFPLQEGPREQLYRNFFGSNDWAQAGANCRTHSFVSTRWSTTLAHR